MRIAGVELPNNKRLVIALTYIYGIGLTKAQEICKNLNFPSHIRTKDITSEDGSRIQKYIEENFMVEGDLKRKLSDLLRRKIAMKLLKALRILKGLPTNGQRTHTNGNTAWKLGGLK